MKITKIRIDNFLGIASFVCDDLGKWNLITGANGVGKSTILKAIREALESSGTKHQLVRVGADKGEVHLTFDNGMTVDRNLSAGANSVTVLTNDQPVKKPQTFLDSLLGPYQMNPVDFMDGNAKQRRATILKALPVTLTHNELMVELLKFDLADVDMSFAAIDFNQHAFVVLSKAKKIIFDTRATVNRDITRMTKAVEQDQLEIPPNFNQETVTEFDVVAASENLAAMVTANQEQSVRIDKLDEMKARIGNANTAIVGKQKELDDFKALKTNLTIQRDQICEAIATDNGIERDVDGVREQIKEHTDNEELRNRVSDIKRRKEEIEELRPQFARLDGLHKRFDNELPKELIQRADLPIPGLELDGDKIKFNGVELDNLSTSEQIKLALEIAKVHAGDIPVICVDRFESLDPDARKTLEQISADDNFEYFVAEVTAGDLMLQSDGE